MLLACAVGAALLVAGLAGFRLGAAGGGGAAVAPAATTAPAATAATAEPAAPLAPAGPAPVGVGGDGQAVVVDAVEVAGGTVRVEVTAANPSADERALGSATDPPVLEGADPGPPSRPPRPASTWPRCARPAWR